MPPGLKIRDAQMKALEEDAESSFRSAMEDHVREFAPRLAPVAGESGVRRFVEAGLEHARQYGLESRESIRFFLDAGCVLGWRFDTDPQYPWAGKVLNDPALDSEDLRVDLLARFMDDYLREAAGPDNVCAVKAVKRLDQSYLQRLNAAPAAAPEQGLEVLRDIYPEKFAYVGAPAFRVLLERAANAAREYGVPSGRGMTVIGATLASFGHGALEDPLYPWIAGALTDSAVANPEGRIERLYTRLRTYVHHVVSHLEGS